MRALGVVAIAVLIATGAGPQIAQTALAGVTAPGAIGPACDAGGPGFDPSYGFDTLLDAELPNGTDVIGTSHIEGHTLITVLHALTAGCKPVRSFGTNGTDTVSLDASPSWQGQFGEIDTMAPTPSGGLLLGGTDGPDEVVGQLLATGRVDPSFGTSGWARFSPREKALGPTPPIPIATSITESPAGTIYVGGNDSEAHCCIQDFAAALTPNGRLEGSFGQGGWVKLTLFEGSFITDVFAWGGDGVLVQGFVSFTGCGGPVIVRLDSRGVFDQRFDRNVARSIAAVSPDHALFFAPALFPRRNGAFALVGDVNDFACITPLPGRQAGRGLVVGLTPDGQIDPSYGKAGRTYFAYDDAFGVWAAPGRAGSTVVIMEAAGSSPSGLPKDLKIRELSSAGLVDPTFGRVGTATVALSAETAGAGIAIGAVPGPDDGVLIGLGSEERVQVVRLQS